MFRDHLQRDLPQLQEEIFDGIYSVSVLEHVPEPALGELFQAVSAHLRPGGQSFHCVDCVTEGTGARYHIEQCLRILSYQHNLAGKCETRSEDIMEFFRQADRDLETCYLSPAGHNLWRAGAAYDTFPFRKVLSFQTVEAKECVNS
jgi:2-polyprenyl-3-methyl-5-hydroxy-6-metoxy-1,4-benzoquinol methylase